MSFSHKNCYPKYKTTAFVCAHVCRHYLQPLHPSFIFFLNLADEEIPVISVKEGIGQFRKYISLKD